MGQANSKSPFSINDLREFEDLVEKEGTKLHAKNSKKGQVAGEEIQTALVKFQEHIDKVLSREQARVQIQPIKEGFPEGQPILFQPQESEFELVQRVNELQNKLDLSISEIQSLKDENHQQKQEIQRLQNELRNERTDKQSMKDENHQQKQRLQNELQNERTDKQSLKSQNDIQKVSIQRLKSQVGSQSIEIQTLQQRVQEYRAIQNKNEKVNNECIKCKEIQEYNRVSPDYFNRKATSILDNNDESTCQIFVKYFNRTTKCFDVRLSDFCEKLWLQVYLQRENYPEEFRLIYAGKQLEFSRQLSDYGIQKECTVHAQHTLSGDIGVFDDHLLSQGRQYLVEQSQEPFQTLEINSLIQSLTGDPFASMLVVQSPHLDVWKKARVFIDEEHAKELSNNLRNECTNPNDTDDFKMQIDRVQLQQLVGEEAKQHIEAVFADSYDEIVVRRCQSHGKMINFHTDVSLKTLQVSLNDDTEYEGGRLIYATQDSLYIPERKLGTITIHDNRIVHGVTLFSSGIRYGLFLLKKC
ncbi:hypothetical protein FGO68_gene2106 [Halteria grandinella]|uniref:Ubiquitin-like domain-containing protein n=1 Tax=Halteria grandinella TaxID=5974 RepID=A0A8J8T2L5_HALGN|nr:hypothetical protein FGO68_gene2106 [Halteria grandinella]